MFFIALSVSTRDQVYGLRGVICTPVFLSFLDLYPGFDFMFFSLYQIMGTDQENHGKIGVQIKLRHLICTPVLLCVDEVI